MTILSFTGFIKNITYRPKFIPINISEYDFKSFDINLSSSYGIVRLSKTDTLAYSKWVTPKRTRSYPGNDTSNNDRINFITYSWMNLLNVYIILAWHDTAVRNKNRSGEKNGDFITDQKLNNAYILKN
ncbi:MAG: hypothetical protein HYV29_05120 [Ignavibacteriales bacterium]|nr:hypothetical protein [Ignavibacteriales bacterium]